MDHIKNTFTDQNVHKKLHSQVYDYAEDSIVIKLAKSHSSKQVNQEFGEPTNSLNLISHPYNKASFRTTFYKTDQEIKVKRIQQQSLKNLSSIPSSIYKRDFHVHLKSRSSVEESVESGSTSVDGGDSISVAWENILPVSMRSSRTVGLSSNNFIYDDTKPTDPDVINQIVRLRDKVGWRTMLPRHGPGVRQAMKTTNHKNPMQEMLNMKDDNGDFVYALLKKQKNSLVNPFALKVVSANDARTKQKFFIITASYITKCTRTSDGIDSEVSSIIWWLYEQRLFNMICHFNTFVQFRIWKQFQVWKLAVRASKVAKASKSISKSLFLVDERLQGCILYVKSLCEDICGSRDGLGVGENAVCLLKCDSRKTYELAEFVAEQENSLDKALKTLHRLRRNLVLLTGDICREYAENKGIDEAVRLGRVSCKQFPTDADLGLKETSYAQLAAWRKVLRRLSSFISYLDCLIQDTLHRLAASASDFFLSFLVVSNRGGKCQIGDADMYNNSIKTTNLYSDVTNHSETNGYQTLKQTSKKLYLKSNWKHALLPEGTEEETSGEAYLPPVFAIHVVLVVNEAERRSVGASDSICKESSSQPSRRETAVRFAKAVSVGGQSRDSTDSSGLGDEESEEPSRRQSIISEQSLQESSSHVILSPSKSDFDSSIQKILDGFNRVTDEIKPLSHACELRDFTRPPAFDIQLQSSLELLDEADLSKNKQNDKATKNSESSHVTQLILDNFRAAIAEASAFIAYYNKFCSMVDESRVMDVDALLKQQEWSPEEFAVVLYKYTEMTKEIREMKLTKRVAMLRVDARGFASSALPYPQTVVDAVHRWLPQVTTQHNEELLSVVRKATQKLDSELDTVEKFVDHLTFLARTTSEMPVLDQEYLTVTRFFKTIKDYGVWLDPEQLAIFQTLVPAFQHLKNTLLFCEAKKDDNITKFSSDLDQHVAGLRYQLFDLRNKVAAPQLLNSEVLSVVALESIKLLADEVGVLVAKARSYANYQDRFGSSYSTSSSKKIYTVEALIAEASENRVSASQLQVEISEVERDITLRKLLWESSDEWVKLEEEWKATEFLRLNIDIMQANVSRFMQTIFMLEKGLPRNEILPRLKESVMNFKQNMPMITALRNTCLKPRHWDEIQFVIGRSLTRETSLTLGELLKWRLVHHRDMIMEISTRATNEATLQSMLNKLIQQWNATDFKLVTHSSATQSVMIVSTSEEIWSQLEESQITIATIKGSRYVTPIKIQVEDWERKLMLFSRTLDEWMKCQRNWLYLEPVFTTADIQRQLPQDSSLFLQVNQTWRDLMRRTEDRPNALKAATGSGILESLQSCNSNLEKIQKSLEDYLDIKRIAFPRFYFLSNDELLSVLAHGQDPNTVQPHLAKCFANIRYLEIRQMASKQTTIHSMISAEGELVRLQNSVKARGSVEQWLSSVEGAMFDTIRKYLKVALACWSTIPESLPVWVLKHPGQIALTVSQIMFNKDVTNAFASGAIRPELVKIRHNFIESLNVLSGAVSNQNIASHQYYTLEAMIIIYVHIRDIIMGLVQSEITSRDDFEWSRQLLYEWHDGTNMCKVVQADARFTYGCEYIGCASRLVVTPLTDRCFLTLTGAINLHLGGSPAGPAGTGKSETVKDLAKILGKQCVVFNCSEGIDFKMMGQFFSGLSQSGSWCCFDEFNRIDVEVLSVIASQVHSIKAAKDAQALRFTFEGKEIRLNPSCAYFITMNPGYLGRVELPDNLKSLFRPVAMMVPDYALITEIILFSEGFREAKLFSRKVVNLYELASKQLSQQDHYDFGMRAIKSVLVMAGQKKRETNNNQRHLSEQGIREQERSILIHSLKNANLPRFLAEDAPLFHSIMSDLFPGVSPSAMESSLLKKCIKQSLAEMRLEKWPNQVQKIIQLNEQLAVRHGVMLVGPSGGGKTTVRNVLQKALSLYYQNMALGEERGSRRKKFIDTFLLNPKCITLGELYGFTDPNTLEWADGLLAYIVRKYAKELSRSSYGGVGRPKTSISFQESQESRDTPASLTPDSSSKTGNDDIEQEWRWIILDGPVDATWVENLNTALDDTKTLCLANGERINLPGNMRLIFEVDSLSRASPATISRCAMVYVDPVDLGWRPFVKSWINKLPSTFPDHGRDYIWRMFELSIDAGLELLDRRIKFQHLPVSHICIVQSLCRMLGAILVFMESNGGFGEANLEEPNDGTEVRGSKSPNRSKTSLVTKKTSSTYTDRSKSDTIVSPGKWFMETHPDRLSSLLGKLFVFAYTWSVGGVLNREDDQEDDTLISSTVIGRDETLINMSYDFDHFVHDIFEKDPVTNVSFPSGSKSVFSYFVDLQTGRFTSWDNLVPLTRTLIERGFTYTLVGSNKALLSDRRKSSANDMTAALVPTMDTVRYSFLTALLLLNKHPVLLTGDSGVGKTALLQNILNKLSEVGGTGTESGTLLGDIFRAAEKTSAILQSITNLGILGQSDNSTTENAFLDDPEVKGGSHSVSLNRQKTGDLLVNMIQFSALTKPHQCRNQILNKLVKRSRDVVGPPRGKKCIAFVNDLNMPVCDEHGSQPPLELIRQFLDLNGFYDTKRLSWKTVSDVTIAATAAPPGGGRSVISERTLKHFSVFALPQPSTRSLQHIYQVQLGHFIENKDFMPEVKECCPKVVNAAIAVYYKMCNAMLPTPNKSHYTFNLRDMSAVIKGVLQADESVIVSREMVAQLFAHEATRIFHDRLTDDNDRKTFYQFLSDDLHNYFKITVPPETLFAKPFIFGDFTDLNAPTSTRTYRHLPSYELLSTMLEEYHMRISGSSATSAHLVFFKAAINHVMRAARVFRQEGTHMLLVGIDGTGKSTSCKLAARIAGCQLYRLSIVRGYTMTDFREELKKIHRQCGVKNTPTVFLLTDADLVSETFLEDINCMLNTGEDAELFDQDELDAIVMEVKQAAIANDVADSRSAMLDFFRQRVTKNLHIAIATSPAGGTFRHRCRIHPVLVNCCTIDWYDRWPEEALTSVACSYFSKDATQSIRLNNRNDEEEDNTEAGTVDSDKVSALCVRIHFSASSAGKRLWNEMRRRYYTTPTTYLEFIQLFTKMLEKNKNDFNSDLRRLHNGLHKLAEAKSLVNIMQEELVGLGPKIEQKSRDTDRLMIQLKKDTEAVNEVREIVRLEEETMRNETQLVKDFAHQAAMDLQSVLPALQNAVVSLDSLDKSDIAELRVYKQPPQMVLTVMNAVCILLQTKADWPTAKHLLADPLFLKKLVLIDRDTIPNRIFNKLKKLTMNPDFNVSRVGEVSVACKSICAWVLALQHYNDVKRMVEPKQRRVREAREALAVAQENLKNKQASLNKIQKHLTQLKAKLDESVTQQETLKERKIVTGKRLQRAAILISALADEEGRWNESVFQLKKKLGGLIGDTLMSAASVAYLGPFIRSYRDQMTKDWLAFCQDYGVFTSAKYGLIKTMGNGNQIRTWHNQGLPRDVHSTVNAVIIQAARRWPLIIDPQGQATNWIKQMEKSNLRVVYASESNYMKSVENSIRVGETLLLCDVGETLDPELRPVLQRDLIHRSGQDYITIGGTEITYNHNFRLYMTTSRANPHFLPAVCIAVTIVNFGVTFKGLQGQLLSNVVTHQRPHLETQRGELLKNIADDMHLLQELEDKALMLLEKQQGHILDDEDLISTLKQSKLTSAEVLKRLNMSEENEKKTELARARYLPVATRGAVLYFVLADLEVLSPMYQFSLQWFTGKFLQCIDQAHADTVNRIQGQSSSENNQNSDTLEDDDDDLEVILQKMIDVLTLGVYKVVSYSLFNEHQLAFSFLLATAIMRNNEHYKDKWRGLGALADQHWNVFLHTRALTSMTDVEILDTTIQNSYSDGESTPTGLSPDWLSKETWRQCQYISWKIESFEHFCHSLLNYPEVWKKFFSHPDPFRLMETPCDEMNYFNWVNLSSFEKILLIKVMRPESLLPAIRWFVHDLMGEDFIQSESFNLDQIFSISHSTVPLIFILSPGSDPSAQLLRYAKEVRGSTLHVDMVSLGRGQGPKAEDLIQKAQILKGRWVFLQNCHLAASFMPRLQAIVEELKSPESDIDSEFRLLLSSKPDSSFPVPILQNGLKMAVEQPRGIRAHLQLAFGSGGSGEVTSDLFDYGSMHGAWKPLLFSLCCFNALVHERRKFGTLGFNLLYDFTSSDLEVSVLMLKQLLEGGGKVPWSALLHLTGEVVYGGRVTDNWDRRCLVSTLKKFYCGDALKPQHHFSRDGTFRSPDVDATFAQMRNYINGLPMLDPPDLFGMNDNAEKAHMESEASWLIDVIIRVQPKLATASVLQTGKTDSEVVAELTKDMLQRLPSAVERDDHSDESEQDDCITLATLLTNQVWQNLLMKSEKQNEEETDDRLPIMQSALLTVARQEIDRFNKLLGTVQSSLKMLNRAIAGEIVMSESLEQIFNALLLQKVPKSWQNVSYESCKLLGSWLEDLLCRINFFSKWSQLVVTAVQSKIGISHSRDSPLKKSDTGASFTPREEPTSYWLSAFFFPQGFLTGVLQNYARKHKVPVDTLSFNFNVQNCLAADESTDKNAQLVNKIAFRQSDDSLKDGVRIFGLYLDSARWDTEKQTLVESSRNIRYFQMPEIHFIPVQSSSVHEKSTASCYDCPLYRTSVRAGTLSSTGHSTNFVSTVRLQSKKPADYWTLQGTALLCQLDD